jgi:hypothetical protein
VHRISGLAEASKRAETGRVNPPASAVGPNLTGVAHVGLVRGNAFACR